MFGVKTILCGTGKFAGGEVAKRAWDTVATYVPKKFQKFEDYREPLESKIMGSSKAYNLCCVPFIVMIAWHCLIRPPAGIIDRKHMGPDCFILDFTHDNSCLSPESNGTFLIAVTASWIELSSIPKIMEYGLDLMLQFHE